MKVRKLFIAAMLFVGIAWSIEMVTKPYLLKIIIDAVTGSSNNSVFSSIVLLGLIYLVVMFVGVLVTNFYNYLGLKLYPRLTVEITRDMLEHLMMHSYNFFQNNYAGAFNKKIHDISHNFAVLICIPFEQFFMGFLRLIVSTGILFFVVNPMISLGLVIWTFVFIAVTCVLYKKTLVLSENYSIEDAKVGGVISDSIINIASVKLFSGSKKELESVNNKLNSFEACCKNLQINKIKTNFVQGILVVILMAYMFGILFYYQTQGLITVGDLALVIMLMGIFVDSIYMVGRQLIEFSRTVGICSQALSIIREPFEVTDTPNARELEITNGEIKFENVAFSYSENKILFSNLNLSIQPKQKVGLVGLSGAGKSTLIKILLRLYDIQEGVITIDSQNIKEVKKKSLRNLITAIPQEPELFHRSILENIKFAKPDSTNNEIIQAAKQANCHQFIDDLPDKYDSLVGERGIKLSGGQRQRIAIARAILKNTSILVLDEATSALDTAILSLKGQ